MPANNPQIKGKHVVLRLTRNQAIALRSLVGAANADRDHEDWLRSACATPADIRATRDCMALTAMVHNLALKL